MRKKYLIFILLLCSALVYIGVLYYSESERNKTNLQYIRELENNRDELKEKISISEGQNQSNESTLKNLLDIMEKQVAIISSIKTNKNKDIIILPIYTMNIDNDKKEVEFYISVPEKLSLEENLNLVANNLSKHIFSNLPIEIIDIKEINGKEIAIVNLKELKENEGIYDPSKIKGGTWRYHYFQGSAGGAKTSTSLIESFLQKGYEGDWIDGVKFLYNNEEIGYDHVVELEEIIYRSN